MRLIIGIVACGLVALAGGAVAEEKAADPKAPAVVEKVEKAPAAAAEKPAGAALSAERQAEIDKFVKELGDDNPKVRQEATDKLRKLGKDALPALAQARKSDDLEVSTRAEAISRQIEEDAKPKTPTADPNDPFGGKMRLGRFGGAGGQMQIRINGNVVVGGGGMHVAMSRTEANGVKDTTVNENGRTIKIHEEKDGAVTVTLTEPNKEGKDETKEYKAKDLETLKKEHPEGHALYEKYGKGGIGAVQIRGFNIQGGGIQMDGEDLEAEIQQRIQEAQKRVEEMRQRNQKMFEERRQLNEEMRRQNMERLERSRQRQNDEPKPAPRPEPEAQPGKTISQPV